ARGALRRCLHRRRHAGGRPGRRPGPLSQPPRRSVHPRDDRGRQPGRAPGAARVPRLRGRCRRPCRRTPTCCCRSAASHEPSPPAPSCSSCSVPATTLVVLLLTGFLLSSLFASLGAFATSLAQERFELARAMLDFALGSVSGAGFRRVALATSLAVADIAAPVLGEQFRSAVHERGGRGGSSLPLPPGAARARASHPCSSVRASAPRSEGGRRGR